MDFLYIRNVNDYIPVFQHMRLREEEEEVVTAERKYC